MGGSTVQGFIRINNLECDSFFDKQIEVMFI